MDAAALRLTDACDHFEQRAFSTAGGADDRAEMALRKSRRDVVQQQVCRTTGCERNVAQFQHAFDSEGVATRLKSTMQNFRRTTGWIALGAFSFIVLSIVLLRLGFSAYLNSSTFRKKISDMTAHALKANGDFQALHLAGSTIYSDGFLAQGTDAAFFSKLCADQLRADFNWRGLLRRAWQIDDFEVQRLEVNFAERQPAPQPREP